jgi:hypothetical protein
VDHVNTPLTEAELAEIQKSMRRVNPFGASEWSERTSRRLGLESTMRRSGRPRITEEGS